MSSAKLSTPKLTQLREAIRKSQIAQSAAQRAKSKAESLIADAVDEQNAVTALLTQFLGEHSDDERTAENFDLKTGAVIYAAGSAEELRLRGELAAAQLERDELKKRLIQLGSLDSAQAVNGALPPGAPEPVGSPGH